jgi:hypothetical protein
MLPVSIVTTNLRLHQIEYNRLRENNKGDVGTTAGRESVLSVYAICICSFTEQKCRRRETSHRPYAFNTTTIERYGNLHGGDLEQDIYAAIIARIIEKHYNRTIPNSTSRNDSFG